VGEDAPPGRWEFPEVRIIPVIDLREGRAVRGRSGDRKSYGPVESCLAGGDAVDLSNPVSLLSAYRAALRPDTVYVADLDRIVGSGDNDAILQELVARAPQVRFLWDGGFSGAAALARAPRSGRVVPVIGTETLRSIEELRPLCRPGAGSRPVLSLDLRAEGVVHRSALLAPIDEERLLVQACRCGFRTVIVLFLDRIGTSLGLPLDRLARLRAAAPQIDLLAGGGIGSIDDLRRLHAAGFGGALLATALHNGAIKPDELGRQGFAAR
jgi:phosphoribosylformimino-5-aminoimidazole carboxamide ribotide isomerase